MADQENNKDPFTAWLIAAGLALAAIVVYCPSFSYPFVNFDDPLYVTTNPHVQAGLTVDSIGWAFSSVNYFWHPLTWLSLELDATLYGGRNAGGFHFTNVMLHAANTVLLFWVFKRMTGAVWRSAMVAALFALHPLNVESVAWVTERKGLLSTFFWILTLAAYHYYTCRPGVARYLLVVAALCLGLMAKPMVVTLPFVLLLLDYWPLCRLRPRVQVPPPDPAPPHETTPRSLLFEKVPLLALAILCSAIAYIAELEGKALPSLARYPMSARVWNALLAYVGYLGKLFWPARLAVHYPHPGSQVSVPHALEAGLFLLVVTALVLGLGRRWRYLPVGWLWYLGTLVPVIGLVQIGGHSMADRYTYVPMIGIFLMLTWALSDLARISSLVSFALQPGAVVALCVCTLMTWLQLGYWKDNLALWQHAAQVVDNDALIHNNLGGVFQDSGRHDEAIVQFRKAIALDPPASAEAHANIATILRMKGKRNEALAELRQALEVGPHSCPAHLGLGDMLKEDGKSEQAIAEYLAAIESEPTWPLPHSSLGRLYMDLGRPREAMSEYLIADKLDPQRQYRHEAARAAAWAGTGAGHDTAPVSEEEMTRMRGQALAWLQSDLDFWTKLRGSPIAADRDAARQALSHWKQDPALANVRDPTSLAKLPTTESAAWRRLWEEVDRALAGEHS